MFRLKIKRFAINSISTKKYQDFTEFNLLIVIQRLLGIKLSIFSILIFFCQETNLGIEFYILM